VETMYNRTEVCCNALHSLYDLI